MDKQEIDYEIEEMGGANHIYKIEEIYLFISEDSNGEGMCGFETVLNGRSVMMLMAAADKDRLNSLMGHAKNLVRKGHKKIKLIKFTNREDIQEIEG